MCKFLRFASEQEAKTFLADHVIDGQWITASHTHCLDPVGTIEGVEGWHLNYIGSKDVSEYEVFPTPPQRVFA